MPKQYRRRSCGDGSLFFSEARGRWIARVVSPTGRRFTFYGRTRAEAREKLFDVILLIRKAGASRGINEAIEAYISSKPKRPVTGGRPFFSQAKGRWVCRLPMSNGRRPTFYGKTAEEAEAKRQAFIIQTTQEPEPEFRCLNTKVRMQILERDFFRCQLCGRKGGDGVRLEIDHKIPKAKGGRNTLSNLWVLCFACNNGKSDRLLKLPM